jgi:predicted membrane protein
VSGVLDRGWARVASLVAALVLMVLVTLLPRGLTLADGAPLGHDTLTLVMWGLSAGFVHGVGFVPRNRVLRVALGPYVAWPLMAVGLFFFVQHFTR